MANYSRNFLSITGEARSINRFMLKAQCIDPNYSDLSFNSLIPEPLEFKMGTSRNTELAEACLMYKCFGVTEGVKKIKIKNIKFKSFIDLVEYYEDEVLSPNDLQTAEQNLKNKLQFRSSCDNWNDWRMENWGTRIEAFDVNRIIINDKEVQYLFTTLYSLPYYFLTTVSLMFPDLTFTCHSEDDMGNGDEIYKVNKGKVLQHKNLKAGKLGVMKKYSEFLEDTDLEDTDLEDTE